MTLTSLDMWRLADDISVLDASILINNGNPAELLAGPTYILKRAYEPRSGVSGKLRDRLEAIQEPEFARQRKKEVTRSIDAGAEARKKLDQRVRSVCEVLKQAILNDRLAATFVFGSDDGRKQFKGKYSELISFRDKDALLQFGVNWEKTIIAIEEPKKLACQQGSFSGIFLSKRQAK